MNRKHGIVIVITGPSAVGKGTLIREVKKRIPELECSVSATTRPPRPGEQDGVEYYFLSAEEFEKRVAAGEFVEHATYAGNWYGTLRAELDRRVKEGTPVILEIEVQGARQIRQAMPEAVQIFIMAPSPEALRERIAGRGADSPEQISQRLAIAEEELKAHHEFTHEVVNDQLAVAIDELEAIIRQELARAESA